MLTQKLPRKTNTWQLSGMTTTLLVLTGGSATPLPESFGNPLTVPLPSTLSRSQIHAPWHFAFFDLPQGHWAQEFVTPLVNQGILSGFPDGSFRPNDTMTRGEFAVLLNQIPWRVESADGLGLPPLTPLAFADVSANHWAAQAIQKSVNYGLMKGYADGYFRPEQPISRLEALITLSQLLPQNPQAPLQVLAYFYDQFVIPPGARAAIATATLHGLVVTYPDPHFLNPSRLATRAEVCAFLHQILVYQGKITAVPSPYIAQAPLPTTP